MRGRSFAAAITVLSGAVFVAPLAFAQDEIRPADTLALDESGDAAANNPFPLQTDFGASRYSFTTEGDNFFATANYSATPSYDLTGTARESVTLRDVYMSAEIVPNLQLDIARWSYGPTTYLMDGRSFGLYDNPVIAGSGMRSPFATMGISGNYIGGRYSVSDQVSVYFGRMSSSLGMAAGAVTLPLSASASSQFQTQSADIETTSVGLDWSVTDWAELGVSASRTQDNTGVLGDVVASSVRSSASSETVALGISARVGFGEGWVTTVAYSEGVTQLDLNSSAVIGIDSVRNQSFGFSVAKIGLFGEGDALGLSVSQPLGIHGGTNFAGLALSSVLNARSNTLTTRESDFTVGYVTTFMDGALALQANTTYSLNANGEQGQDAVSVLSRAQIKF